MDLSHDVDEDDDTHICLKCHSTIIGLDNYVSHRKNVCCKRQNTESIKSSISMEHLEHTDPPEYPLRADDFFSSLELQSSAKTVPAMVRPPPGILTRSKTSAAILASSNPHKEINVRGNEWIGGHQLNVSGSDNHAKLIKAVDNISGHTIQKKEHTHTYHYEHDVDTFKADEDSNEYTDEEEDDEYEDEDCNAPPRTHTGGKWKPRSSPLQWSRPSSSHDQNHEDISGNDWIHTPPPTHTGGKWKPTLLGPTTESMRRFSHEDHLDQSDEDDGDHKGSIPPPGHTKGKWIPGRQAEHNRKFGKIDYSEKTTRYWCTPCNRTLASKVVFERHIKSNLHRKRSRQDRDPDSCGEDTFEEIETKPKRIRKVNDVFDTNIWETYVKQGMNTKQNAEETQKPIKRRRKRGLTVLKCDVCHAKVYKHLIGKHLVSHYHYRKGGLFHPLANKMILDNIASIILQSPFQCSACRFYCNTQAAFMQHWHSEMHRESADTSSGIFSCSFCKFECYKSSEMETHLRSENHQEVVLVINRSVPIVIQKRTILSCGTCSKEFKYNVQLKRHCVEQCHLDVNRTTSDKYQQRYVCQKCGDVKRTVIGYKKHLFIYHDIKIFVCSICSKNFKSLMAARKHRRTLEHKYAALEKRIEKGTLSLDMSRNCAHCPETFENVLKLKQHLLQNHPTECHSCPQCGMKFALSQDVAGHIRSKDCQFGTTPSITPTHKQKCYKCNFKTESRAELLFHEVLHDEPLVTKDSKFDDVKRYKCPICSKFFRKASLRCHLRRHTSERPFVCNICNAGFVRKHNLINHIKSSHENNDTFEKKEEPTSFQAERDDMSQNTGRPFLCAKCGKSFRKRQTLQQHMMIHAGKTVFCTHPGCMFAARFEAELRIHMLTHSDTRAFMCTECDYSAKTKSQLQRHMAIHGDVKPHQCPYCPFSVRLAFQLKRHLRLHTGAKPYKCPHCNFACNNLENLRKHVLSTKKHPGKCIYECKLCADDHIKPNKFATNLAKEFRVHMLTEHAARFESAKEATSYNAGIYDARSDPNQTLMPLEILPKTKRKSKRKPVQPDSTSDQTESLKLFDTPSTNVIASTSSLNTLSSTLYLTSAAGQSHSPTILDIPKDDSQLVHFEVLSAEDHKDKIVYIEIPQDETDTWAIEGCYDVEESGTLVPFHSDNGNHLVQVVFDDADVIVEEECVRHVDAELVTDRNEQLNLGTDSTRKAD